MSTSPQEIKIINNKYDPNDVKEFQLTLRFRDNEQIQIIKTSTEKYCHIISPDDKINSSNIISYQLDIYNKFLNIIIFSIENSFEDNLDEENCYVYKNNQLYIEFIKINNYLQCSCFIKNLSSNTDQSLFYTPPNY